MAKKNINIYIKNNDNFENATENCRKPLMTKNI